MAFNWQKALNDAGKMASEAAQKAASATKKAVNDLPQTTEKIKNDGLKKTVTDMASETAQKYDQWQKDQKETHEKMKAALAETEKKEEGLTAEDSLKIIYSIIAADRVVSEEEKASFGEMGEAISDQFSVFADDIQQYFDAIFEETKDEDDTEFYAYIHDVIALAVDHSRREGKPEVNPKLLLWDLFVVAQADHDFSANEKALIRFYAKTEKIDPSVLSDMIRAYETINAIEREKEALIHQNLSYAETQPMVEELDHRTAVVMASIQALIQD